MLLTSRLCLSTLFMASLTACLPVDGALQPRDNLAPRSKKYSVVNVDGGSTDQPTSIVDEKPATVTLEVTTTPTSKDKQSAPTPSPKTTPTKEVVVTVVVTETASPTKFYDDGMWQTRYPVKTFLGDVYLMSKPTSSAEPAAVTAAPGDSNGYDNTWKRT